MSHITLDRPWLEFDLDEDMQVLSWALNRPGFVTANQILWREVRNADLPIGFDVKSWLVDELQARKAEDAVTLLTSRNITHFTEEEVSVGDTKAHAVATVGFSNAERVGHRVDRHGKDFGTINVALRLSSGLTQSGLLEAMSIVVQARTAAVMEAALHIDTGIATGTGTDCVAVAAPKGVECFAGLHTEIGEAIGRAVYNAVHDGAKQWLASKREIDNAAP
ncbi:MAG: adenosylcobinamide amidohydrolase [Pseudomonadota bacterium]